MICDNSNSTPPLKSALTIPSPLFNCERQLSRGQFELSAGTSPPRGFIRSLSVSQEDPEGMDVGLVARGLGPPGLYLKGKPKNTGVGCLSFLQQIFLTQESNWGLLPCRRILYQLGKPQRESQRENKVCLLCIFPMVCVSLDGLFQALGSQDTVGCSAAPPQKEQLDFTAVVDVCYVRVCDVCSACV